MKLFLINANLNEISKDPESSGVTTKKITRLVWSDSSEEAIQKLNNKLKENFNKLDASFNLTNIEVNEAVE